MQTTSWRRFRTFVDRYQGDYKVKTSRCSEHSRVMAFAQRTYRESLCDIEACLRAMEPKLYHLGIRSAVSRNNLSNANDFTLPALQIAELYKSRWQIELFFKWIKQHLRVKSFFGASPDAVKVQRWIAIMKKRMKIDHSLYTILQS